MQSMRNSVESPPKGICCLGTGGKCICIYMITYSVGAMQAACLWHCILCFVKLGPGCGGWNLWTPTWIIHIKKNGFIYMKIHMYSYIHVFVRSVEKVEHFLINIDLSCQKCLDNCNKPN